MDIIGEGKDGNLICEVSRNELEKFFNCFYRNGSEQSKKIQSLKPGQAIDLSKGYDHLSEINSAFHKIKEFVGANESVIKAISSGLILMSGNDGDKQ